MGSSPETLPAGELLPSQEKWRCLGGHGVGPWRGSLRPGVSQVWTPGQQAATTGCVLVPPTPHASQPRAGCPAACPPHPPPCHQPAQEPTPALSSHQRLPHGAPRLHTAETPVCLGHFAKFRVCLSVKGNIPPSKVVASINIFEVLRVTLGGEKKQNNTPSRDKGLLPK